MFFHLQNLKIENNNPWFKPWFDCVCHSCQCLEYLGYITLKMIWICPLHFWNRYWDNIRILKTLVLTYSSCQHSLWTPTYDYICRWWLLWWLSAIINYYSETLKVYALVSAGVIAPFMRSAVHEMIWSSTHTHYESYESSQSSGQNNVIRTKMQSSVDSISGSGWGIGVGSIQIWHVLN